MTDAEQPTPDVGPTPEEDVVPENVVPEETVPAEAVAPDETVPEEETADTTSAPRGRGRARAATIISLRIVRGLVGAAAAVVVVGGVGLVPLPTIGIEPLATTVTPEPAEPLRLCAGSLLRLGDDTGANAGQASAVGTPRLTVAAEGGTASQAPLAGSDAGTGGTPQAPTLLSAPADATALAGAQAQTATGAGDLEGLAVSACTEPSSSQWLVGGSMTVGRTTMLLIANPTAVTAEVTLRIWGESGPVSAPGMSGIRVAPGTQRVLPLTGFAPGLASPVVHVEARGGQVVAALQTSVIRVLDPGGVDTVSAGVAPSRTSVVPAVRIADEEGVSSVLGIADYADLEAVARIGNPGETDASVELSLLPADEGGTASSFQLTVPAGTTTDVPLSSALELGEAPIPDGSYSVVFSSDQPVVTAVRASTTPVADVDADGTPEPGDADLAWFAAAPVLGDGAAVAVADAPSPVLVAYNPDNAERTLTLTPIGGGESLTLVVPPARPASIALDRDTVYLLDGAVGLRAGVTFAASGRVGGYTVTSPREGDSPLVVRP
ncbi:DUF5719 family protein [Protaetiibacter intestinalis]|uniref:Large extracellular alpha-helical protein n=1 Tax=Protaetiibacter intestinalis TaxID=2419774 RepID=A0A387B9D1_9MICO|nr:DUF5719 family protein [Protaetiibacter intestinalis]AYF98368.1 hypothetical protein D7I47_08925 [Protaetiibacter intestinalis]